MRFDSLDSRRLARDGTFRADTLPLRPGGDTPLRVAICTRAVDSGDPLLFHKTTERTVYTSRTTRHPECDDVILVNQRGEVTESTIGNVVARLDDHLWTPPLESGPLPGVLRGELLQNNVASERIFRPEDLRKAEAVWIVNSVRGARRVLLVPPDLAQP